MQGTSPAISSVSYTHLDVYKRQTVYNVKEADNSNQQKKGRQHINHVQIQIAAIQDATSHQENDLQTQQHSKHYWDKHSSNNPETSAELPGAQSW